MPGIKFSRSGGGPSRTTCTDFFTHSRNQALQESQRASQRIPVGVDMRKHAHAGAPLGSRKSSLSICGIGYPFSWGLSSACTFLSTSGNMDAVLDVIVLSNRISGA